MRFLKGLPKTGQSRDFGKEEQSFNLSDGFFLGKQPSKEKDCDARTGNLILPEANVKETFTLSSKQHFYLIKSDSL